MKPSRVAKPSLAPDAYGVACVVDERDDLGSLSRCDGVNDSFMFRNEREIACAALLIVCRTPARSCGTHTR